jgi:hypothetical protein
MNLINLIHLSNFAWILGLFIASFQGGGQSKNYWDDPVIAILLIFSSLLQLYRWIDISKAQINEKFESTLALKLRLRQITEEMFGKTPYLLKISPNDHHLEVCASNFIKENFQKTIRTYRVLQYLVFNIKNFFAVNIVICLVSGGFLYFGDFPSYFIALKQIPGILSIVLCAGGGLFVYSMAFILFSIFLYFCEGSNS